MEVVFGSCARMKKRIKFLDVTFGMFVPNQCLSFLELLKTWEGRSPFFKLDKV